MAEFEWKEPPPPGRIFRDWRAVAVQLQQKPNTWALVHRGKTHFVSAIRHGRYKDFRPAGVFQAVARDVGTDDDGARVFETYARYVGGVS